MLTPVLLVNTLGCGSVVGQTNGTQLIARPRVGSPRDVFAQDLDWLLDGITAAGHQDH